MMQLFGDLGYIRWPMIVAALFLLVQIARAAAVARDPTPGAARTRHAILAWGLLSALLGVLGTVIGLAMAGRRVAAAGAADPALVGAGIQVALTTTILGLLLLIIAVTAWLILQLLQPRAPEAGR
jgi:uncharacterized membrane protein YhaH (DUF805 family)